MKPILVTLFLSFAIAASDLSGIVTAGYGTLYNYEKPERGNLDGSLLRFNPVLFYKNAILECDIQARNSARKISPFALLGCGYRVLNIPKSPNIWLTGSWMYSSSYTGENLPINRTISGLGAGFIIGIKGLWLRRCFANFSMSYYPSEKSFYKSMQIGWELYKIGFSTGGLGIRLPEGRYYSSFVFAARMAFGENK